MSWQVYILRCVDGSFYVGCTNRLEERVRAHNDGRGAKYTRGRCPVTLVYAEKTGSRSQALKREIQLKKWSRARKADLVERNRSRVKGPGDEEKNHP